MPEINPYKPNTPKHYQKSMEPWDYIITNKMGYLEGNVIKYVSRYKEKGGKSDLLKAITYLQKLIEVEYPTSTVSNSQILDHSKGYVL